MVAPWDSRRRPRSLIRRSTSASIRLAGGSTSTSSTRASTAPLRIDMAAWTRFIELEALGVVGPQLLHCVELRVLLEPTRR